MKEARKKEKAVLLRPDLLMSDRRCGFYLVTRMGLSMPDVEATSKYDGSPILKLGGCFMAGLATHRSAEPDTLVVRCEFEQRELLLQDSPDTYYLTDHYRSYPVVLARLSRLDQEALHDLLFVSWRLTAIKARKSKRNPPTLTLKRAKNP
jgi:hypothetical protein